MGYRIGTKIILIAMLVILGVLIRVSYQEQWLFDSFRYHAMAQAILDVGYANWVFHPASIFGYYPLSYPSGLMFFLSSVSAMTTLSMDSVIFIFSLVCGALGTLGVFILCRELGSWFFAYLAALLFAISPYFANFTAYSASGRILITIFFPFLVYLLTKAATTRERRVFYIIAAAVATIMLNMTHRMGQLLIAVWGAWVICLIYVKLDAINEWIKRTFGKTNWHRFLRRRYKSKLFILVDLLAIVLILIGGKVFDLVSRGRLWINVHRYTDPYVDTYTTASLISLGIGLVIMGLAIFVGGPLYVLWRQNRGKMTLWELPKHMTQHYNSRLQIVFSKIAKESDRYFSYGILMIFAYLFVGQFFGRSFYAPSFNEFKAGTFISGGGPHVIFINMVINYLTGHGLLFPLSFVGFLLLVLLKRKSFLELYLVVLTVVFSPLLLDTRYTRMFLLPLYAVLSAVAVFKFLVWFSRRKNQAVVFFTGYAILTILIVFSTMVVNRGFYLDEEQEEMDFKHARAVSEYIKGLNLDSSLANDLNVGAVYTFAYSGIPSAPFNTIYYVDKQHITPTRVPFAKIKEDFLEGRKISSFWILDDWIFGGNYYWGRHGLFMYNHDVTDPTVQRILDDYRVRTFVHYEGSNSSLLFTSLQEVKNKIFENPTISVWDLEAGRE